MSGHRGYVGPKRSFDLIAAMTFNLLTKEGLREFHSVLDIGCGCLRVGRLLIQYLNKGNYVGIEPNQWLVDAAFKYEMGADIILIKEPEIIISDRFEEDYNKKFDYIFAQSIFSHAGLDLVEEWLEQIASRLKENGRFLFTFFKGKEINIKGWIYPDRVNHNFGDLIKIAEKFNLKFKEINHYHPHDQHWVRAIRNV